MSKDKRSHVDDLRGASKLAIDAAKGITSLVETMHKTIGSGPASIGKPLEAPTQIATDIIYGGIRAVTELVGLGVDGALKQLTPLLGGSTPGAEREAVQAILNGVLGDYLHETENPLAIKMQFRKRPVTAAKHKSGPNRLLVLVHGSCMNDEQWAMSGHDHGAALERDLGFAPAYLYYNTGLHVSTNGAELAHCIESLVQSLEQPVDEVVIVAHNMGGLVARSACNVAETDALQWRSKLRSIVFLGTPHHGSPLERAGNWIDTLLGVNRYSAPLSRLGKIRSAGVTDLRYGNVLDEHWRGRDRFEMAGDDRVPLPLPAGVSCFAIAGSVEGALGELRGDGLVPVSSALGEHDDAAQDLGIPNSHTWVGKGVWHSALLSDPKVYQHLHSFLEPSLS